MALPKQLSLARLPVENYKQIGWFLTKNAGLMKHEKFSNSIFIVGPEKKEIPIIKALFAANSKYFEALFYSDSFKKSKKILEPDVSVSAFLFIQNLFYHLNPVLTASNVVEVYVAANKFLLQPLMDTCLEYILQSTDPDHLLPFILKANEFGLSDLKNKLSDQLINKYVINSPKISERILYSKYFVQLPISTVLQLLQDDRFGVQEEEIWFQCQAWCKHRVQNSMQKTKSEKKKSEKTKKLMKFLAPYIRFSIMKNKFFTEIVAGSGVLTLKQERDIALHSLNPVRKISFTTRKRKLNEMVKYVLKFDNCMARKCSYENLISLVLTDGCRASTNGFHLSGVTIEATFYSRTQINEIQMAAIQEGRTYRKNELQGCKIQMKNSRGKWVNFIRDVEVPNDQIFSIFPSITTTAIRLAKTGGFIGLGCLRFYGFLV